MIMTDMWITAAHYWWLILIAITIMILFVFGDRVLFRILDLVDLIKGKHDVNKEEK